MPENTRKMEDSVNENLRIGINASMKSILGLAFLAALKGSVGLYSGSTALIADAVHTSLDILTSLAVWIGFKLSLKDSRDKFPYGYYKAENLVALLISIIIFISGFELIRQALASIKHPVEIGLQGIALGTAVFSVLAMYTLSVYKARIGRQIDSQALTADAIHSYTDVFSSLVVAAAVGGSIFGMPWLDNVGVLIISLMIFRLGIGIARDSALVLMDAWLDRGSIESIRQTVGDIQGVTGVEDIRLRKSGLVVFGEIIIETQGDADLKKVEMLSDEIRSAVKQKVNNLEHIVVNVRPGKMAVVKVAVPVAEQSGLRSKLSRHFGKAPFFLIIQMENDKIQYWDVIENPAASLEKKKGVKTAEFLISRDINILIIHDIGEGPFHVLRDNSVKIMQMPEATRYVEEFMEKFPELNTITSPTEDRI